MKPAACAILSLAIATTMLAITGVGPAAAGEPVGITVAVAAFDNDDSAGESQDRTAAHATRVAAFPQLMRDAFARTGRFVRSNSRARPTPARPPPWPRGHWSTRRGPPARILIYGGIHKMSTLVQVGKMQAVDLGTERLLIDRLFTFRGDDDRAFAKAADFMVRQVDGVFAAP